MTPQRNALYSLIAVLSLFLISCEVDEEITLSALSKPHIPENIAISEITDSTIAVQWNPADVLEAVDKYLVYQNNVQVAIDSSTSYVATGLASESEYTFSVRAINRADKISDFSAEVSGKTKANGVTIPEPERARVLVFTKTAGFRHTSIDKGVATLTALGADHNFEITHTENSTDFNSANLSTYAAVVFLNTTGDILDVAQQEAFQDYMKAGGSFMGIHSASDTEHNWPWYGQLVGAYFDGHPDIQNATMKVKNNNHKATEHLGSDWTRTDEWYNFKNLDSTINVLLNLDESSYQGGTNGENHPIAWYHEFDGGRSFYTGGGHTLESYDEPDFKKHLLGGILYCLGQD